MRRRVQLEPLSMRPAQRPHPTCAAHSGDAADLLKETDGALEGVMTSSDLR